MDGGEWGEIPAHVCPVRSQTAAWSSQAARGAQLLPQAVGAHSLCSTSFHQGNIPSSAMALDFLLAHWLSGKGIHQLVAEHEGVSWWLPAGRTMDFVTAQLLWVFVRTSQKVTNVLQHGGPAGFAIENKTNRGSPFWRCFPGISFLLNGSPGHAELCRLENTCGVWGWDLPTCADTTYGLFFMTVLAPGGHHPCCFPIPRSSPTASPSRKKQKEGREEGKVMV